MIDLKSLVHKKYPFPVFQACLFVVRMSEKFDAEQNSKDRDESKITLH
jgi:hypothetical protein